VNRTVILGGVLLLTTALAPGADWPQFRGPSGAGVSAEKGLPTGFNEKEGVRWKAPLPARGVSCPVVVGNKVFVTCSGGLNDDRLHVLAFDTATGQQLWHREYTGTGLTTAHPKTCMAAPTPAADANGVYALFATGDLVALDHAGNQLWYRSIVGDYPTVSNQVGMASSPVLAAGKLFVPMENSGESFLAAIDTKTGKNLWKTARPRGSNWTTPTVRTSAGKETEVLFQGPKGLVAYDAESGSEKWTLKAGGSVPTATVLDGDLLLPGGGVSRFTFKDNKWQEVWKAGKLSTGDTSPLVYEGKVYTTDPRAGIVYCTDAATGKPVWDEKIVGAKQTFSASPIAADGKVYTLTEKGTLTVFKAGGTEADILATSEVGATCIATPAVSGGALFIRTDDLTKPANNFLLCVGKK
jgi:outer membrane protein assembly factor BamB